MKTLKIIHKTRYEVSVVHTYFSKKIKTDVLAESITRTVEI